MAWSIDKPVVVPFDFSEHSEAALKRAASLVSRPELLHVLHVLPFLIPTEPGVVWATVDDAHRIQHALESLRESVGALQVGNVELEVRLGDPGQIACDRAEELAAELIAVGSHGRTGLTRMLLGSVAERVVRLAHCPVLVVKMPTAKVKS
jgi:nucleotide-binding universal stress UspA family protein